MIKIIVDVHEKNSMVFSELVGAGVDMDVKKLEVGDYVVGDVVVERKTMRDFIRSMINKRLLKQLDSLVEAAKMAKVLFLLEGNFYDVPERLKNAVLGMLLAIATNNISVLQTSGWQETARVLLLLAKKQEKKPKKLSKLPARKSTSLAEQQRQVLEALPGVGPVTASGLLKKFGSIKAVVNASLQQLQENLGKKAAIVKKIFEEKYEENNIQ